MSDLFLAIKTTSARVMRKRLAIKETHGGRPLRCRDVCPICPLPLSSVFSPRGRSLSSFNEYNDNVLSLVVKGHLRLWRQLRADQSA
jgi:hypothetical protein